MKIKQITMFHQRAFSRFVVPLLLLTTLAIMACICEKIGVLWNTIAWGAIFLGFIAWLTVVYFQKTSGKVAVSVIIPVYNAEKYIRQCLDSLLNQTCRNIEIICVDDGSTDKSPLIIEDYVARDPRFKLVRQQNKYAGVARQNGMSVAKGSYFAFMDADDFVEPDMLEKMLASATTYGSDIVVCGVKIYRDATGITQDAPWLLKKEFLKGTRSDCFKPVDILGKHLYDFVTIAPWAKIFRADFVRQRELTWSKLPHANDVFFVGSALAQAQSMSVVDEPLVNYRDREDSISHNKNKRVDQHYYAYGELYRKLLEINAAEATMQAFKERLMMSSMFHVGTLAVEGARELRRLIVDEYEPQYRILETPKEEYHNQIVYMRYKTLVAPVVTLVLTEDNFPANTDWESMHKQLKNMQTTGVDFLLVSKGKQSLNSGELKRCANENVYCSYVETEDNLSADKLCALCRGKYVITLSNTVLNLQDVRTMSEKLQKRSDVPSGVYEYARILAR